MPPKRSIAGRRMASRSARHAEGEFLARSSLRNFLSPKGRIDEADAQMDRIAEISSSIDDPALKAQIWIVQASHIQDRGGDLGVAYRLLKQAERALFPVGPYRQQRICLTWLGLIAFRMGRHDEALELFKSLDALAAREGDLQTRAVPLNTTSSTPGRSRKACCLRRARGSGCWRSQSRRWRLQLPSRTSRSSSRRVGRSAG